MRGKRVTFPGIVVPAILLAPQLAITFIFFVWPAIQSLRNALFRQDAFGLAGSSSGSTISSSSSPNRITPRHSD